MGSRLCLAYPMRVSSCWRFKWRWSTDSKQFILPQITHRSLGQRTAEDFVSITLVRIDNNFKGEFFHWKYTYRYSNLKLRLSGVTIIFGGQFHFERAQRRLNSNLESRRNRLPVIDWGWKIIDEEVKNLDDVPGGEKEWRGRWDSVGEHKSKRKGTHMPRYYFLDIIINWRWDS